MQIKRFDSINVVPFIDIMLVLLVIVLTTATFISKGEIPIALPSAKSAVDINNTKKLNIFLTKDNKIYFNKEFVLKDDFELKLKEYESNTTIKINCDKDVKFEEFVYILDTLKNRDFNNIAIVTKNE
jgi:biopolymer transport protein ExbD